VKLRILRKIRVFENEEVKEEWKKAWTNGSSKFLFLAMFRTTRPRMTRWARRSVYMAEKQIACIDVFGKLQNCLTEFDVVSNKVVH
jgi:hypothetical protein